MALGKARCIRNHLLKGDLHCLVDGGEERRIQVRRDEDGQDHGANLREDEAICLDPFMPVSMCLCQVWAPKHMTTIQTGGVQANDCICLFLWWAADLQDPKASLTSAYCDRMHLQNNNDDSSYAACYWELHCSSVAVSAAIYPCPRLRFAVANRTSQVMASCLSAQSVVTKSILCMPRRARNKAMVAATDLAQLAE